jgi:hypothetical protein
MDVLVVSAFYQMVSKRTIDQYKQRIDFFLNNTTCKILIFTTDDCIPLLNVRDNLEFRIVPIEDFYSNQFASEDEYEKMTEAYSKLTAEKPVSTDLLKVYAEKHMFVNRAIDMYPDYKYYIWTDIGFVIGEQTAPYLPTFPSISKIQSLNIGNKICFAIRDTVNLSEYNCGIATPRVHLDTPIAGTIILGNKNAWRTFIHLYHRSLLYMKNNGYYWGNDEHVYFNMLCNDPNNVTGVITYGFKLPIQDIYQCNSWNMFAYMLSDLYTGPIETFKPVRGVEGYSNIQSATWGSEDSFIDVTEFLRNKKDTSRLYVDYKLFPYDPAPKRLKYLEIDYTDGRTQRVREYSYVTLNRED